MKKYRPLLDSGSLRDKDRYMHKLKRNQTPWPESASELYRPSDRRLSANLVPTFADRGCHVVSVADPYVNILGFLDRSRYFFFEVAPKLYSRGWVDPVPDSVHLRKSGSAGNRNWTSGLVARNANNVAPSILKELSLTSPTSGGRSIGIFH
jgi:hypothetical protein